MLSGRSHFGGSLLVNSSLGISYAAKIVLSSLFSSPIYTHKYFNPPDSIKVCTPSGAFPCLYLTLLVPYLHPACVYPCLYYTPLIIGRYLRLYSACFYPCYNCNKKGMISGDHAHHETCCCSRATAQSTSRYNWYLPK